MYCAHCGVELMKSTDRCPLCETPVHPMPAPETSAPCRGRLRRKTRLNLLFLALCLHVIAVVLATDLALNNGLSWSVYVMGAVVLVYFWVIFPLLVSKARECLSGALNFGLLAVYLWAIEQIARRALVSHSGTANCSHAVFIFAGADVSGKAVSTACACHFRWIMDDGRRFPAAFGGASSFHFWRRRLAMVPLCDGVLSDRRHIPADARL